MAEPLQLGEIEHLWDGCLSESLLFFEAETGEGDLVDTLVLVDYLGLFFDLLSGHVLCLNVDS